VKLGLSPSGKRKDGVSKKVQRKLFGSWKAEAREAWRNLQKDELHNSYFHLVQIK
jgi:hypothetical protein